MTNPGPLDKHQLIYEVVKHIPRGKVSTYGQVAVWAGLPGHARLAGYALFNLPQALWGKVPWQRVVNAQGRISYSEARLGHDHLQRDLLEAEGVEFGPTGKINLSDYAWEGPGSNRARGTK
jgi:methylated-DNA-protein-cysteine methyltransferase-like protein